MSETSSEVKTHRKRPSDEVLKHNEACRRSRRSYTLCKKAFQLEQAGGVQVFALVKDRNGNVTYYASDELERKFENSEPLVEHPSKDKCFHYNPETFGIDLPHLPQVMHPTPDKSPGKTPNQVASFIPGKMQRDMLQKMALIPSTKPMGMLTPTKQLSKKRTKVKPSAPAKTVTRKPRTSRKIPMTKKSMPTATVTSSQDDGPTSSDNDSFCVKCNKLWNENVWDEWVECTKCLKYTCAKCSGIQKKGKRK